MSSSTACKRASMDFGEETQEVKGHLLIGHYAVSLPALTAYVLMYP